MVGESHQRPLFEAFARGPFLIPSESPIEPGREVAGALCEPSIVFEESARARISGTGMLWLQGLVPENILDPIASALSETVGSGSSPTALLALIEAIAAQSGLKEVLQERRWTGTVDRFWRSDPDSVLPGPLLNAVPEKPDFRTRSPMLKSISVGTRAPWIVPSRFTSRSGISMRS
jgi:hypothetical protein